MQLCCLTSRLNLHLGRGDQDRDGIESSICVWTAMSLFAICFVDTCNRSTTFMPSRILCFALDAVNPLFRNAVFDHQDRDGIESSICVWNSWPSRTPEVARYREQSQCREVARSETLIGCISRWQQLMVLFFQWCQANLLTLRLCSIEPVIINNKCTHLLLS